MRKRIYIWVIIGINLLVLTSQAAAQREQWLQYHSSREARQIISDMGASTPKVAIEKPQGVKLPQTTIGEVEVPTTVSRGGNWIPVLVIVGIAVVVAGLAMYKKKTIA